MFAKIYLQSDLCFEMLKGNYIAHMSSLKVPVREKM